MLDGMPKCCRSNWLNLQGADFAVSLLGFDEAELNKLLDGAENVKDDHFDLTSALEQATFVLPGDVWTLGRHRLICGDATDADTVEKLMDGHKANLVLTDPPYNVSFESASGLKIKNDNQKSEQFYNFLLSAFRNLADNLEGGGSAYIFHADTEGESFRRAFREAGFHLSGTCIWAKDSFVMGRSPYQWPHEPILYGWLKTGTHKWDAGRSEATIGNFAKPKKNRPPHHKRSTCWPTRYATAARPTHRTRHLWRSGSTLIACRSSDRICYMLKSTRNSSVILRRYATFKQKLAAEDITCERDGKVLICDLVKEVVRPWMRTILVYHYKACAVYLSLNQAVIFTVSAWLLQPVGANMDHRRAKALN